MWASPGGSGRGQSSRVFHTAAIDWCLQNRVGAIYRQGQQRLGHFSKNWIYNPFPPWSSLPWPPSLPGDHHLISSWGLVDQRTLFFLSPLYILPLMWLWKSTLATKASQRAAWVTQWPNTMTEHLLSGTRDTPSIRDTIKNCLQKQSR